ncbi:DNA binding domain protein [Gordonia phage Stormageddon]|uniref:DNA binding domain protein n=1 Tax=Gordonia phage Stormageddon TaxID=2656541 RepID=A0A649VRR0_9CAUD|nr:DNA binding domain protein [Gordonia phage Stormageddon]QGJ94884.1 DNA binding domain protein [Gordonia phage Stormageddon]
MIHFTTAPELADNQHLILDEHMGVLNHRIELANRKLDRNGIADRFSVEVIGDIVSTSTEGIVTVVNVVEISHPAIGLDGVRFIGTVEIEQGGTILRMVPGEETPAGFERPDTHNCDHCGKRRNRAKSYLVIDEATGEVKQIGSTCLELYFGVTIKGLWALGRFTAEELAEMAEVEDERFGGPREPHLFSVRYLIAMALYITNGGKGFVSKAAAGYDRTPTSAEVMNTITYRPGRDLALNALMEERHAGAAAVPAADIDAVLAFADTLGDSDYGLNAQAAARSEHISYRSVGVLISLVGVRYRAIEKDAQREVEKATTLNEWVGEPKQRLRGLELTVRSIREMDGQWGTTTLLVMRDAEGHTFKWFATGTFNVEAGDVLKLDATVKAHDTYEGAKQTVLTRGRVLS